MRVDGQDVVVTMRTPGDDLDLAAGFLLTEGWIRTIEDIETLAYCPDEDDPDRRNFSRTGGIHGAGLFDPEVEEIVVREAIGAASRQGTQGRAAILMLSGRLGFEIAQKALAARIPVVASVSAPSSLALEIAEELGLTAAGFVWDGSMNVYTHPHRVKASAKPALEGKQH